MKTLTLIAAIAATAITAAVSGEKDEERTAVDATTIAAAMSAGKDEKRIYVRPEKDFSNLTRPNTTDIRIHRGERRKRETAVMTDEFTALSGRLQLRLEAKFGGAGEALKHPDAIKYDCYFHATQFCRKYNDSDSATRAYELQEYVTIGLQEKATKNANRSNTLANTVANN